MEDLTQMSPFDLFTGLQETYEEALQKNADENRSFAKVQRFTISAAGTYPLRILPLAPVKDADGNYSLPRKGYEYPLKAMLMKLDRPNSDGKKDKNSIMYVNVVHASMVGMETDLIDTYVDIARQLYGNDKQLMDAIAASGYYNGLKWDSQRAVYVLDMNKRKDGIQMLTLSYSQYKDLEDLKLSIWDKLRKKDPKTPCPISSVNAAYPVEIIRKDENKRTSYSFNIDVLSGTDELDAQEVQALMDAPRLPDVLYRYSRYHMEATIEFLKQFDAKHYINVMDTQEMKDAIERVSMELPADDKSHFSFDKKDSKKGGNDDAKGEGGDSNNGDTIEDLTEWMQRLKRKGVEDRSEEGRDLRDAIREFIDVHQLPVRDHRSKTNESLLEEVMDALEVAKSDNNAGVDGQAQATAPEDGYDDTDEGDESQDDSRRAYNDDTSEPAMRSDRRQNRPARRRD